NATPKGQLPPAYTNGIAGPGIASIWTGLASVFVRVAANGPTTAPGTRTAPKSSVSGSTSMSAAGGPSRGNTCTAPWSTWPPTSVSHAPTSAVSPDTETELPNWSLSAAFAEASVAVSLHAPPARRNTCAAPTLSSNQAPITATSPSSATELPNSAFAPPAAAVSLASSPQVVPER